MDESQEGAAPYAKARLQAGIRRKHRFNMTYQAAERVDDNLLKRNFTAEKPSQKNGVLTIEYLIQWEGVSSIIKTNFVFA